MNNEVINTGLEPGYYDIDELMLHGCFALLCRYIEDEQDGAEALQNFIESIRNDEYTERQVASDTEALSLYHWWKVERPENLSNLDKLYINSDFNEFNNLENKILEDEQVNLKRLIDIRRALWT